MFALLFDRCKTFFTVVIRREDPARAAQYSIVSIDCYAAILTWKLTVILYCAALSCHPGYIHTSCRYPGKSAVIENFYSLYAGTVRRVPVLYGQTNLVCDNMILVGGKIKMRRKK